MKRQLGPVAWAVLEDVLLDARDPDGLPAAETNVRRVAGHLGITKDTAARALARLIDAGLFTREQRRDGAGFSRSLYLVDLNAVVGVTLGMSERPDSNDTAGPTCPRDEDTVSRQSLHPENTDAVVLRGLVRDTAQPPDNPLPSGRRRRHRSSGRDQTPAQDRLFELEADVDIGTRDTRSPGARSRQHPSVVSEPPAEPHHGCPNPPVNADSNHDQASPSRGPIKLPVNQFPAVVASRLDVNDPEANKHLPPLREARC